MRDTANTAATVTGSGNGLAPLPAAIAVPTLTVVFGPARDRWGERIRPKSRAMPLDRVSGVFPGGPLDDREVSRVHARIVPVPADRVGIEDLGSKNGTFVNGVRVGSATHLLEEGDVVRIGDTLLLFHMTLEPAPPDGDIPGFWGTSDGARAARGVLARVAPRGATVLLQGESGTGKEVAARAVASVGRPGKAFVAFNAAAVPATLVDSMLFGHLKGAFTDAREPRPGVFRAADGGTLFLDEIGELAPETQVKLLRVLEERAVVPLGASRAIPIDVRVVAATNRDLLALVRDGRFRGDLYARLAGVVVSLPPLRERVQDIPELATRLADGKAFSVAAMLRLLRHPWPFNVRELRSAVEQALSEWDGRHAIDLPEALLARMARHERVLEPIRDGEPPPSARQTLDAEAVRQALERHGGNMARTAQELGKDRGQFYRLVKRLGLDPDRFRG